MSIYASLQAPDDRHSETCAIYDRIDSQSWRFPNQPCNCGQPDTPLVYQGSHVLPTKGDPRGGWVDLALIPGHVRYWRDHPDAPLESEPDGPPESFLRFGVNNETVVLERHHVEQIHQTLGEWLKATSKPSPSDTKDLELSE